jgi:lipid A 4'-phosphatase
MSFLQKLNLISKFWLYPFLFALLITPLTPWIDLFITRYFYSIGNDPVEHFLKNPILNGLFDYGTIPANLTALIAAILLIGSYLFKRFKSFKNPCLVLLLVYAMGAGLIINGILKEYWGRPRPKQVEEFGGTQPFRPYYQPNFSHQPQPSKSFTCGHCATGFYFFALAFVGKRLKKPLLWKSGLLFALILGIALSLARIMQGGHFFSDTLFSALIMWYTTLIIDWLVYAGEPFP